MLLAFVVVWLLFGLAGAVRHLTVLADHPASAADLAIAALMIFGGPGGLFVHAYLFRPKK